MNVMKAEIDSGTLILPESSARRKSSRVRCIMLWAHTLH